MDIPVKDMQAWVTRPREIRFAEVAKRKGHISRPMNSFMLYRSAYAERTKAWCAENNHQIVSSVSGASWPLEPQEVRDFYNELAKIERVNHQTTHPDYKFCPSKPAKPVNKRRYQRIDTSEDEEEDDRDPDWTATHRVRGVKSRAVRDASYPPQNQTTLEQAGGMHGTYMGSANVFANAPAWDVGNGVASLPNPMQNLYQSQYDSQVPNQPYGYGMIHHLPGLISPHGQQLGSNLPSRVPTPIPGNVPAGHGYSTASYGFVGLPGATIHHDMLGQHQSMEGPVDPLLAPYNHDMPTSIGGGVALPYGSMYYAGNGTPDPRFADPYRHPQQASIHIHAQPVEPPYQRTDWRPDSNDDVGGPVGTTPEFDAFWEPTAPGQGDANSAPVEQLVPVEQLAPAEQPASIEQPAPRSQTERERMMSLFGEDDESFTEVKPAYLPGSEEDADGEVESTTPPTVPESGDWIPIKLEDDDDVQKSPKTL
jgi:hypothetical protein